MKGDTCLMVLVVAGLACAASARAAEHGGQEHGGQEHGGAAVSAPEQAGMAEVQVTPSAPPSAEAIRAAIRTYVTQIEATHGALTISDTETGQTRALKLDKVHERVGKTGNTFYSCADLVDTGNGDKVDVDFDVSADGGQLQVVDTRIHKVNGKARYTYDANDNRIPL